jgi:nucleoside-diphosphate-sugar epimerase
MKNVLVLGAGGQIARWVIEMLKNNRDLELTLFLRHLKRLKGEAPNNSKIVEGMLSNEQLHPAMAGQDIVYANLIGDDIDAQAANIVNAVNAAGVKKTHLYSFAGDIRRSARQIRCPERWQ